MAKRVQHIKRGTGPHARAVAKWNRKTGNTAKLKRCVPLPGNAKAFALIKKYRAKFRKAGKYGEKVQKSKDFFEAIKASNADVARRKALDAEADRYLAKYEPLPWAKRAPMSPSKSPSKSPSPKKKNLRRLYKKSSFIDDQAGGY